MTIDGALLQTLVVLMTANAEEECNINEGIVSHANLGGISTKILGLEEEKKICTEIKGTETTKFNHIFNNPGCHLNSELVLTW